MPIDKEFAKSIFKLDNNYISSCVLLFRIKCNISETNYVDIIEEVDQSSCPQNTSEDIDNKNLTTVSYNPCMLSFIS